MCGDGRHPPEAWGHLTYVHFAQNETDGSYQVDIKADDLPDRHYILRDGVWADWEGVEVADPVGVAFLNLRCFGS